MPRKMRELLQLKDAAKNRKKQPKPKPQKSQPGLLCVTTNMDGDDEGHTRGLKFVPSVMQQGPYESEFQFMQRLNKMAARAKAEAQVEEKFDVDFCPPVERNRPKILSTKTGKEVKYTSKGKIHVEDAEVKRSRKAEKRREREAKKKAKKRKKSSEDRDDVDTWIDHFDFDDVVQEPPSFSKRRGAKLLRM